MKLFFASLFFVFVLSNTFCADLTEKLELYWSFNSKTTTPSLFIPNFTNQGYSGSGITISKKSIATALSDPIYLRQNFSVVFWFKPHDPELTSDLLSIRDENGNELIDFNLQKQTIACKLKGQEFVHYPYMILDGEWSMLALSYDGQFVHLTLFSSQITSTSHFKVPNCKLSQISEIVLGGQSGKSFYGVFDEFMIYSRALSTDDYDQMYNGVLPQERVQAKSLVVRQVLPEVQHVASSQIDRDSERIENSMNITQPSLILDVLEWKSLKGHFDVFLNDTRVLSGLSDRTGMPMLNFSHNQTNTLRIVRLDKSPDIYRFKAILWNGPKQLETLRADLEPNVQSLFQLNHHDDHLVVTEIQKIIVVSTRKLKIEVWDDKLLDGDFISIYCNGVKLIDYEEVLKTPIVAEFTIDTNLKNIVTFVSEDEGKYGNNSARVRIYENNVPVDEFLFNTNLLRRAGLLIQYRETNQRDKN